jgi:hypothetical protein
MQRLMGVAPRGLGFTEGAAAAAAAAVEEGDGGNSMVAVAAAASPLGLVPHQIRGFLVGFQQQLFAGPAFSQCTACSPTVVRQWRHDAHHFVLKARPISPSVLRSGLSSPSPRHPSCSFQ